ncbi:unnamed protein product [Natator depressus]
METSLYFVQTKSLLSSGRKTNMAHPVQVTIASKYLFTELRFPKLLKDMNRTGQEGAINTGPSIPPATLHLQQLPAPHVSLQRWHGCPAPPAPHLPAGPVSHSSHPGHRKPEYLQWTFR